MRILLDSSFLLIAPVATLSSRHGLGVAEKMTGANVRANGFRHSNPDAETVSKNAVEFFGFSQASFQILRTAAINEAVFFAFSQFAEGVGFQSPGGRWRVSGKQLSKT